jgi:hypothetical protein
MIVLVQRLDSHPRKEQVMRRLTNCIAVTITHLAALTTLASIVPNACADEPLRWKFQVGDKFDYSVVLDVNMTAGNNESTATMHQELDMTWDVQGVDADSGEAVIRQKFDRIKMKLTLPKRSIDYDSKSEKPPSDAAARIAPVYKAIAEGDIEITMTARGEVRDVKIPDEVVAALKSSPGAAELGEMTTAEGFKKMVTQGLLLLPKDPPKPGQKWTSKLETDNPKGGKQIIETTYIYEGTKDVDGTTYAVIKPQQRFDFVAPPENDSAPAPQRASIKVVEQSSEGEVLFNVEAGRLHSMTVDNKVTVETSADDKPIQPKIEQKIVLKLAPVDKKKSDEPKPPEPQASKKSNTPTAPGSAGGFVAHRR